MNHGRLLRAATAAIALAQAGYAEAPADAGDAALDRALLIAGAAGSARAIAGLPR
jgi:hypothetical protein